MKLPINTNFKKFYRKLRSKSGFNLSNLYLTIIITVVCLIIFGGIRQILETQEAKNSAALVTGLQEINQTMTAMQAEGKVTYGFKLINTTPPYRATFSVPPVSAYETVNRFTIESAGINGGIGDRFTTFDTNSQMVYEGIDSGTMQVSPEFGDPVVTGPVLFEGISNGGSDGVAPFIPLSIPKIEEDLLIGLFNQSETALGKSLISSKMVSGTAGTLTGITPKSLLEMILGTGNDYQYIANASMPDRWMQARLVDSKNASELLDIHSNYMDPSMYRLYVVNNVVTKSQALQIAATALGGGGAMDQATEDALGEAYDAFAINIRPDQIIAIPLVKDAIIKSEKSQFKRTKFSTTD